MLNNPKSSGQIFVRLRPRDIMAQIMNELFVTNIYAPLTYHRNFWHTYSHLVLKTIPSFPSR